MSANMPQVVALVGRFLTAIIAILLGGLFVRWGVHLYREGVMGKSGTLKTVWKDSQFMLSNGAPGTFLSVSGVVVMVTALLTMPGYDAGTVKVSEARPETPQVRQPKAAPAPLNQLASAGPGDTLHFRFNRPSHLVLVLNDTACMAPPGQYLLTGHNSASAGDSMQRALLTDAARRCAGAWSDSASRHQFTIGLAARLRCSDSVPCANQASWRMVDNHGIEVRPVAVEIRKPWWQFWR
jgi:hypothetical protein